MKKLINATLLMLIVFLFIPNMVLKAQFECYTENSAQALSLNDKNLDCSFSGIITEAEKATFPIVTIYVNIHFVEVINGNFQPYSENDPNYNNPDSGNRIGKLIIEEANSILSDITLGTTGFAHFTGDAKYRFELYSEDTNEEDLYGGIWYWDHEPSPAEYAYGEKTLNLVFIDQVDGMGDPITEGFGGRAGCVGGLCNDIEFYNFHTQSVVLNNSFVDYLDYARFLGHEFGHTAGLFHSFDCSNPCGSVDLDLAADCVSSPCENVVDACDAWSSNSINIMGYNWVQTAFTPCQWGHVYKNLLSTKREHISLSCENINELEPLKIYSGTNIVWNDMKLLNRNVIVETGATLTIQCEVLMGEKKIFEVHRGAKLFIDGGEISRLCPDTHWGGIQVWGNPNKSHPELSDDTPWTVNLESDDAGAVFFRDATIEYARNAVQTDRRDPISGNSYSTYWGGLVYGLNTTFRNNHRVAAFMKYEYPNKSKFKACSFIEDEEGEDFDDETIGVTVWACDGISFETNHFEDLDVAAISGINYTADIHNGNSFTNCKRGIEIYSTSSTNKDFIIGHLETPPNHFINNSSHSIRSTADNAFSSLLIRNNDFTNGPFCIVIEGGNAKFDIRENTFNDISLPVYCKQTGFQPSLIDCNFFINHNFAILFQGDNSQTQFRGNHFSGSNVYAVKLDKMNGANGIKGEIAPFQGKFDLPAGNCFHTNLANDIKASVLSTISFTYITPPDGIPQDCDKIPQNSSGNNYDLVNALLDQDVCSQPPPENPPVKTPKRSDLISVKADLNLLQSNWENNPSDVNAQFAYLQLLEEKIKLIDILVRNAIEIEDFQEAESILLEENTVNAKKGLYSLKIMQHDYTAAAAVLNTLPQNTSDEQNYITIQGINLQRLTSTDFVLSTSQYSTLQNIVLSESGNKGGALGLLFLLKGERYPVILPEDSESFLIQLPENNPVLSESIFKTYPNPAQEIINIRFPVLDTEGGFFLQLSDINGRNIVKKQLDNTGRYNIKTQDYPEGIYFLTLMKKDKISYQQKIIISR